MELVIDKTAYGKDGTCYQATYFGLDFSKYIVNGFTPTIEKDSGAKIFETPNNAFSDFLKQYPNPSRIDKVWVWKNGHYSDKYLRPPKKAS